MVVQERRQKCEELKEIVKKELDAGEIEGLSAGHLRVYFYKKAITESRYSRNTFWVVKPENCKLHLERRLVILVILGNTMCTEK